MSDSLQDRLKRLGLSGGNANDSKTSSSQVIPSWQRELDQYKRQQDELNKPRTHNEESPKHKRSTGTTGRTSSTTEPKHIPSNQEDEVVFLPRGRKKAHLVNTEHDDEYLSEDEPASSSADLVGTFCLFSQVVKFPYKYLQDPENKVSARFFSKGKAFERAWKLYSISTPQYVGGKSIFMVPYSQVADLIDQISTQLEIQVNVPAYPFTISFYKDGTPTPKFLGVVNSKDEFDGYKYSVPELSSHDAENPDTTTPVQEDDDASWREKMETALAVESKKGSTNKRKKLKRQVRIASEHSGQLNRIQRYLGLRPPLPTTDILQPHALEGDRQHEALKNFVTPNTLNVGKAVEYPFEDQTVILAVDIESWEEYHAMITEIGVSTLDTAELVNIPPGHQGENWINQIRSRHFRILGREHMRNVKYCPGDPDNFRFGNSDFVRIDDAPQIVDSCFEWPYSGDGKLDSSPQSNGEASTIVGDQTAPNIGDHRNLLLIGHGLDGDVEYLSQLGSEIFDTNSAPSRTNIGTVPSLRQRVLSSIRERLDTATLYKTLTQDTQIRSLTKVCYDLDITAWHTHNAGNDARYTLEAFIKLALKAREQHDADSALAKEKGGFSARMTLQGLENEIKVQAKLQAAREAINVGLKTFGYETESPPSHTRRRSPSPLFAPEGSSQYGDKITLEEANRRYLAKWVTPLSEEKQEDVDGIWKVDTLTLTNNDIVIESTD